MQYIFENVKKEHLLGSVKIKSLTGINLEIEDGKYYTIYGPSGCGKSRLLYIMGCLDFPSEGKVFYQGRNLLEITEREAKIIRNREVCLIPQQIYINTSITIFDNVSHVLKILGEPEKDINRKVEFWLKELNLWNKRNMLGFDTTASEKLLISIARAMIKDPKILLLDEPLADKEIHDKNSLQALLNRINRKFKVTVVHATKNWELASESDVIILLNGGTVTSTQERNSSLQMAV